MHGLVRISLANLGQRGIYPHHSSIIHFPVPQIWVNLIYFEAHRKYCESRVYSIRAWKKMCTGFLCYYSSCYYITPYFCVHSLKLGTMANRCGHRESRIVFDGFNSVYP